MLLGMQSSQGHQLEELLWEQARKGVRLAFVMHKALLSKERDSCCKFEKA